MSDPIHRRCCKCGEIKPLSLFPKGSRKDGTHSYCKDCYNKFKRNHYSENREAEVKRAMAWTYANMPRFLANKRKWTERNSDVLKMRQRKRRAENPDIFRIYDHNKLAKRRSALGNGITVNEWKSILAKYKNRCHYCGVESDSLTKDHLIALSRGGHHSAFNIVPACFSCNSRKGALHPIDFAQRNGRLL